MAPMTLKRRRGERGAELIELAIVLPILLFVVAAIIDFGFLFQRYESVTNAAREGARIAVLPDFGTSETDQRIRQYLSATGLDPTNAVIDITYPTLTMTAGMSVSVARVSVRYPANFSYLGPIASLVGGTSRSSIMLNAVSVMRMESAGTGGS